MESCGPGLSASTGICTIRSLGTQAALDAGGILELYSSRHAAGRFDLGDTMVWYGGAGARHQLQWSVGLSLWF